MNRRLLVDDFHNALGRLQDALSTVHSSDLEKAGCIQYFEFCFELAWKTLKTTAEADGIADVVSPRSALKFAFSSKLIDEESCWLEMLDARNRMSHTYDAADALDIYAKLPRFVAALSELGKRLGTAQQPLK